jgi:micrococcal nuclease
MKRKTKVSFIIALVLLAAAALALFLGAGGNTTVYVTATGQKYHTENCSSLRQSKIAVSLEDAVRSGYEPCGICKPPRLDAPPPAAALPAENSRQAGDAAKNGSAVQSGGLYRVNVANLKTSAHADIGRMLRAEVVQHVDGDTVRVRIPNPPAEFKAVETIRMLGVDTPETVHPNKPAERFGKEASEFTKSRLLGKNVYLAFDWDLRDRYGRLLAYIYVADNAAAGCFNAELIREGYAHAYTRFAFQFTDEFRALEREARQSKRGLWGEH